MQALKDETIPSGKWEFDESVTAVFDNMLERSIPQYQVMRQSCFEIACHFQKKNMDIVDLGCSRGEAIAPFIDKYGAYNRYYLVDVSEPMLEAARKRYETMLQNHWGEAGLVCVKNLDLRNNYPPVDACITLCVLALQFTPIEYRLKIIQNIYEHVTKDGCLILVEKVIGASAKIDDMMVDIYYNLKRQNGYTEEQIQRKRLSLEGALVPVPAKWNEEMLQMAGFRQVDCFWRWMNFAGWVAIK